MGHTNSNQRARGVSSWTTMSRLTAGTASIAALILSSGAAFAQDAADRSGGVEEIIVTAQKREQNVQDVPIAVTALSQETLQANRVQNVNDLTGLAPGLVSRQNAGSLGSPSFAMRGVFASTSGASQDRQISVYLDGVYLAGARGSAFDLPDLQRIEVLRGPQGTLFGRNATAGAISVVTRDPKGQLAWRQEVTVGNYDQLRVRTTIDSPQFGPFSAFFTYVHDEKQGDVRNLGAGTQFDFTNPFTKVGVRQSPKYLGSKNFENFFASVKFEPTDTLRMVYKYDSSDGVHTPDARVPTATNAASFLGNMLAAVTAAQPVGGGRFGPVVLNPSNKRPKATNNAFAQEGFQRSSGHNLTTTWEASDNISLKNITAYRKGQVFAASSIAGLSGLEFTPGAVVPYAIFAAASSVPGFGSLTPAQQGAIIGQFATGLAPAVGSYFAVYEGNNYGKSHQYSSETQLNYTSDRLAFTVGALWFRSKELNSGLPGFAPNFAFSPISQTLPLGKIQSTTSRATSIAAYAQLEFNLTSQFQLVAGGRITKDKKVGGLTTGGAFVGSRTGEGQIVSTAAAPLVFFPFTFKKTKPTFSVGVNYKPNEDIMVYGKVSSAFLSGGAVGQITFAPETVLSEELGLKSEFLDRRLRVNVALWNAKYKNSQSAQSGANVVINGVSQAALGVVVISNGNVKARGFDLEIVAAPADGLTFGGSLGYTYVKALNPNPVLTQGLPYKASGIAPWVGALNAQYVTQPLIGDAVMSFRVDGNYQGKYRAATNPDIETQIPVFGPYEFSPARWIVNGRVALRDLTVGPAKAEIALWGRNLTNNKDQLYQLQFGDFNLNSSFQPARTYGVDLILDF